MDMPNTPAPEKSKRSVPLSVAIIGALLIAVGCCACGLIAGALISAVGSSASTATNSQPILQTRVSSTVPASTQAPASKFYAPGDVIQLADHRITLNSAEFSGDMLKLTYLIENTGTDALSVSSIAFDARKQDGSRLQESMFDCDSILGGKIPPNDKMLGSICYKGPFDGPVKVYYTPALFDDQMIIWQVAP